ncbi:MAG: glycosyltransferase [candidate division KSB1 bacterium]|nr:glycosyltransferase [candidate division KSB1 bacterium]
MVAARNEQNTIRNCLKALLAQSYPQDRIEFIVVVDQSTDKTLNYAEAISRTDPRLRVFQNTASLWKSSKKAALALAVQQATGEIILFTDADCTPGPRWVSRMVSRFSPHTGLLAGFSPQLAGRGLWSAVLCIDSAAAALVSAGTIGWNHGVTCTGRNLAVRSQALNDIGGYAALPDTLSGDDDFLLHAVQNSSPWDTAYCMNQDATVPSQGPSGIWAFLVQKQRHISSGKHYHTGAGWGYALYHVFNVILWLAPVSGSEYFGLFLLAKLGMDFLILSWFLKQVYGKLNLLGFLGWNVFFPVYHLLSAPVAFLGRLTWK